jgi:hypothetical protein
MTIMRIGKLAECVVVEFCRSFAKVIGGFLVVGLYQDDASVQDREMPASAVADRFRSGNNST